MGLGSGIRDPGSGIQNKPIPDPGSGSRGQKGTGSRSGSAQNMELLVPEDRVSLVHLSGGGTVAVSSVNISFSPSSSDDSLPPSIAVNDCFLTHGTCAFISRAIFAQKTC
jgi:hypothetical protein